MRTRQGRPVQYTDDMIEEAVSDLCRATGDWPSVRSVKERLGGGTDRRIKGVLDRLKGGARDDRAGSNAMAAPAADPAAILGMLGSDALTSQVLNVLKNCLAGLAEVAQSHVDARVAAAQEATAEAMEKKIEAAMAEEPPGEEGSRAEALRDRDRAAADPGGHGFRGGGPGLRHWADGQDRADHRRARALPSGRGHVWTIP